jgi:RNA polymerase sigma-70 factor (ECF subfamily)
MPNRQHEARGHAFDPVDGLRELAALVLAGLDRFVRVPALAGMAATPAGPPTMHSEAHVVRPAAHSGGSGRPHLDVLTAPAMQDDHSVVWQLVEAAQNGDGEAFGQIYDLYVDTVFRFVYFRVNDRGLAEDFTSETFLRALRRISTITYQGRDIGAWLVTIARNIIFDHTKSARHRLEVTTGDIFESEELAPSPETSVLAALTSDVLIAGIKQLNTEQRECVELRFVQGLSVSQTAAAMGKNEGAIKALQHRAVRKLGDLVGGELR